MAAKELRKSANELRRGWALANAYWEQSEPWKVVKADPDAAAVIFRTVINVVRVLAVLASPIIPTSSATVLDALGATDSTWPDGDAIADELAALAPGHPVAVPAGALRQGHRRRRRPTLVARFGGPEASGATSSRRHPRRHRRRPNLRRHRRRSTTGRWPSTPWSATSIGAMCT